MIMVIEAVDGGVKESPTQPASPSAATTDIATTVSVESIPEKDRSSKTSVSVITPYMIGISVTMSRIADSWKALFSMAMPVKRTRYPG